MERTTDPNSKNQLYPVHEEPIVVSKALLDILLKEENPADLIALYCFYYYTAKWQKTNQPRATTEYTASGLKWSTIKVRKVKKQLTDLKLIEDVTHYGADGKITGHFVKINFIWTHKTTLSVSPPYSVDQSVADQEGNALRDNNILNASNSGSGMIIVNPKKLSSKERNNTYLPIARYLAGIILTKKNMNYTTIQIQSWTNDIRQLVENNQVSIERVKAGLKWYKEHIGEQYCPVIESGKSLKEKFAKLEAAMERDTHPFKDKNNTCPIKGRVFGKSFGNNEGCIKCEEDNNLLYMKCKFASQN